MLGKELKVCARQALLGRGGERRGIKFPICKWTTGVVVVVVVCIPCEYI